MTDNGITRRGLIGAGAAAGVALGAGEASAASGRRRAPARPRSRKVDVAIVGAGFAGLTAARELVKAGKSVVVLEANRRVGGRVWNHEIGGGAISERGGTFTGPTQDRLMNMAREVGVELFPTFADGQNVAVIEGRRSTYSDSGPTGTAPPDPLLIPELATVVSSLNEMALTVPVDAPHTTPRAVEWDGETLESWIRDNTLTDRFRRLVPTATRPIFGAEPREISLLFTLFYIAASGNETTPGTFERNFNTRGGAQESRFVGGTQRITDRMARQLGKRVVLRSPVGRIAQTARDVTVESAKLRVTARRVVVALPPALAARIDYAPTLPSDRDQYMQRVGQGTLTKVSAVYDRPFWRDKGLNGTAVSTDGFVSATYDGSPPSGRPGVVFGFVGGDRSRAYARLSEADRRARILAEFALFFGDEALRPREYFDTRWPEQRWSRGGPVGLHGGGSLLAGGPAIRRPERRIHWAGTETAGYWHGYMDGAVRSGERVARELLRVL